jgi:hypothetical protein
VFFATFARVRVFNNWFSPKISFSFCTFNQNLPLTWITFNTGSWHVCDEALVSVAFVENHIFIWVYQFMIMPVDFPFFIFYLP